mmetsp:Transcript_7170/g.10005  ORF Transcript_7170/g.10005 Transcript_7170/m.10005 type:complete len:98 (-) Transcript_7170:448-741(-)
MMPNEAPQAYICRIQRRVEALTTKLLQVSYLTIYFFCVSSMFFVLIFFAYLSWFSIMSNIFFFRDRKFTLHVIHEIADTNIAVFIPVNTAVAGILCL